MAEINIEVEGETPPQVSGEAQEQIIDSAVQIAEIQAESALAITQENNAADLAHHEISAAIEIERINSDQRDTGELWQTMNSLQEQMEMISASLLEMSERIAQAETVLSASITQPPQSAEVVLEKTEVLEEVPLTAEPESPPALKKKRFNLL